MQRGIANIRRESVQRNKKITLELSIIVHKYKLIRHTN